MSRLFALFSLLAGPTLSAVGAEIAGPVHPDEAKVIQGIVAVEKYEPAVSPIHGYVQARHPANDERPGGRHRGSEVLATGSEERIGPGRGGFFACAYNENGRSVALSGDGPWLRNESVRA